MRFVVLVNYATTAHCPICCEEWQKMHLPVYRDQLVRFFQSSTGRSVLPMPVSDSDPGNLTDIFTEAADGSSGFLIGFLGKLENGNWML